MGEFSNYQEVCYFTKQHAGHCATRELFRENQEKNRKAALRGRPILRLRFN